MSESIFETFTDERGNISVRISQEVQVLTREEADRIAAEYKRMLAENAKLRELVRLLLWGIDNDMPRYEELAWTQKVNALVHKLRVEVDE